MALVALLSISEKNGASLAGQAASLDNFLQPVVIFYLFSVLFSGENPEFPRRALLAIVWLGVAHTIYLLCSLAFDLTWLNSHFLSTDEINESIWYQARALGRYTWIFEQPMEAGIFYSAVFMVLVLRYGKGDLSRLEFYLFAACLGLGGSLSLSKQFLLLGLPLSVALLFSIHRRKACELMLLLLACAVPLAGYMVWGSDSSYLRSYVTLYQEDGLFMALTGGRLGSESSDVSLLAQNILNNSPWFGFGLAAHAQLDNGFLEYADQGGICALFFYLFALAFLTVRAWIVRSMPEGKATLFAIAFVFLASFGGPVITVNRADIFVIFLLSIFAAVPRYTTFTLPNDEKRIFQ